MSYCINPTCPKPDNPGDPKFCLTCGSELLFAERYRAIRLLSDPHKPTGFGTIYEADDCGTHKVLKVLHNTQQKAIELFQQEAQVLARLNRPGIPRVEADGYFTFLPRNSTTALHCLVMEFIEGMNLEQYLGDRSYEPISEETALNWLKQLTEILGVVHQEQYFHRDIKPTNIMLRPDGQLVLIDFGSVREVTETYIQRLPQQQVTGIISAGYTPTEQVHGKAVPQSDFFALGRTFVYLLTGQPPTAFSEDSRTGLLLWRNATSGFAPETQISPRISASMADLIDRLIAPFPGNRPQNTQEILQLLAAVENSVPFDEIERNAETSLPELPFSFRADYLSLAISRLKTEDFFFKDNVIYSHQKIQYVAKGACIFGKRKRETFLAFDERRSISPGELREFSIKCAAYSANNRIIRSEKIVCLPVIIADAVDARTSRSVETAKPIVRDRVFTMPVLYDRSSQTLFYSKFASSSKWWPLIRKNIRAILAPNSDTQILLDPAGFWPRLNAYLIDLFLVGAWGSIVLVASNTEIAIAIWSVLTWLYFTILESSPKQATLGKMVCQIRVVNAKGKRLSFWQANKRYLVKLIFTGLLLYGIGLFGFTVGVDPVKKQRWHDRLAGSLVIED